MKKLKEILFKVNIDSVYGNTDVDIANITFDSRNVEKRIFTTRLFYVILFKYYWINSGNHRIIKNLKLSETVYLHPHHQMVLQVKVFQPVALEVLLGL